MMEEVLLIIGEDNGEITSNKVVSSKYTAWSFFPMSLALQFRRAGNIFFSFVVVVMLIGTYTNCFQSPQKPWGNLSILIVVFALNMASEAMDDVQRHKKDSKENQQSCLRYSEGAFEKTTWGAIRRGDIIMVEKNMHTPADILLVGSFDMDSDPCCYVETASVDGETYLKRRLIHESFLRMKTQVNSVEMYVQSLRGLLIKYFPPSASLNSFPCIFNGCELNSENIVLRGCTIRSSKWAIGVVLYTGKETKVLMARNSQVTKQSKVDQLSNQIIQTVLVVLILLILISLLCHFTVASQNAWYLGPTPDYIFPEWLAMLLLYLILYRQILPILLYAVQEGMSVMHSKYINWDLRMYDEETGQFAECQSTQLVQEIGQVDWIFSDKTGTLTRNEMRLVSMFAGGKIYGKSTLQELEDLALFFSTDPDEITKHCFDNIDGLDKGLERLLLAMSLCHTVLVEDGPQMIQEGKPPILNSDRDSTRKLRRNKLSSRMPAFDEDAAEHTSSNSSLVKVTEQPTVKYNAESPDEEALVQGASALGFKFSFTVGTATLGIKVGNDDKYQLWNCLAICPFTSNRKRMSAIYKDPISGNIVLVCKGADNQMLSVSSGADQDQLQSILLAWAKAGLRTLILGERILSQAEFEEWQPQHEEASVLPMETRADELDRVASIIEKDLEILGMTAVEDRLQESVPETLQLLQAAKIKFWLITGDKVETAISIGMSAGLLKPEMDIIQLTQRTVSDVSGFLVQQNSEVKEAAKEDDEESPRQLGLSGRIRIWIQQCRQESKKVRYKHEIEKQRSLVVDGETLTKILGSKLDELEFVKLAVTCSVVLACRVSPKQKADLVLLIKNNVYPPPTTLAIGDGANDVPMIQAGNVGVGMNGREGTHAAAASDFKISKFRFLAPLVLVHGRTSYIRISKAITLTFYANMLFTLMAFLYNIVNDWSGFPAFSVAQYALFQAFIAVPAFAIGWFDRDIKDIYGLLKAPASYDVGRLNTLLYPAFVDVQILRGALHAGVIFAAVSYRDYNVDVFQLQSTMMLITTLVLVFFSIWDSSCVTYFHAFAYVFNVLVLILMAVITSTTSTFQNYKSLRLYGNDTVAKVFVIILIVVLVDYALQGIYFLLNRMRQRSKSTEEMVQS